ncbi:MAG: hypothetical protein K2N81_09140, partial [Acetatifactor sp.]|nr:hypothetical protein [Acetatifactor sp.]
SVYGYNNHICTAPLLYPEKSAKVSALPHPSVKRNVMPERLGSGITFLFELQFWEQSYDNSIGRDDLCISIARKVGTGSSSLSPQKH